MEPKHLNIASFRFEVCRKRIEKTKTEKYTIKVKKVAKPV